MSILTRSLAAVAATGLLVAGLTGCGSSSDAGSGSGGTASGSDASAQFPVTVKNIYGETTIDAKPERVATLSWVNADTALALGTVPVAMPKIVWGNNANNSNDWTDAKLKELGAEKGSDKAPTFYDEPSGDVNYDAIADSDPDVILAAYSGLTKEQYDKLSKIAPVVGPGSANYGTSWQDSTTLIGEALGKEDEAKQVISETDKAISDAADKYPQLKDKTFIAGNFEADGGGINIYAEQDNRSRLLSALGMKLAPVVTKNQKSDAFFFNWSPEKGDELDSDVFFTWFPEGQTKASIEKDKLLGRIPAVKNGGLVGTSDNQLLFSVSSASPLSLQWGVDKIAALLAKGVDASEGK